MEESPYVHVVDRRTVFFTMSAAERELETIKDKVHAGMFK